MSKLKDAITRHQKRRNNWELNQKQNRFATKKYRLQFIDFQEKTGDLGLQFRMQFAICNFLNS